MPDPKDHDANEPDPVRDQEPTVEPASPAELPSPEVDPAAEQDPKVERAPGDPPDDLDDGPLVAMNANRPSEG